MFKKGPEVLKIVARGDEIPRMAKKVERLRQTLTPQRFRAEVLVEFDAAQSNFFDLTSFDASKSDRKALVL